MVSGADCGGGGIMQQFNLIDYINRQIGFSEKAFGHGVRTLGLCKHIRKELLEIEAAPHDLSEWIDVMILAIDGAWRAGYTPEQIAVALELKLNINKSREWPKGKEDEPIEHVRERAQIMGVVE